MFRAVRYKQDKSPVEYLGDIVATSRDFNNLKSAVLHAKRSSLFNQDLFNVRIEEFDYGELIGSMAFDEAEQTAGVEND